MNQPVILITGASSGIGRVTARLLAQKGYQVFGTSRSPEKAQPLAGVTYLPLDVTSAESIHNCVQQVVGAAGRIDVLINNAGLIGTAAASEEASLDDVRELFETNFFGVVQMVNAVLPYMRAQRHGTIINMSSASGLVSAPPFFSFYAASKHALEGYTEGLRYEVRPFNIHVALVEPGYTATEIGSTIKPPRRPLPVYTEPRKRVVLLDFIGLRSGTPPENVAQTVFKVLQQSNPALRNPVGVDSRSILLLKRFLPFAAFEQLIHWMFLRWRPKTDTETAPTLAELGLHRFLFHRPDLLRLMHAASAAGVIGLGMGILLWIRRKGPPSARS